MPYKNAIFNMLLCLFPIFVFGQTAVPINQSTKEHIFKRAEVVEYEDPTGNLSIDDFQNHPGKFHFSAPTDLYPRPSVQTSTYWYKIKLSYTDSIEDDQLLEFYDQTVDEITVYTPQEDGTFIAQHAGNSLPFHDRRFAHKNFEFKLPATFAQEKEIYIRTKSFYPVNFIIVYRTVDRFIGYALNEYFTFGLFYGMIIIFSLNTFLLFLSIRKKQYIYYGLYLATVALYEMSIDGIAFQYLWPNLPEVNIYAAGFFLSCISILSLVFTKTLFDISNTNRKLNQLINSAIALRIIYFFICLFIVPEWFHFKVLEIIPLTLAFATGIWYLKVQHYKPARFFVIGYSFLFFGFLVKLLYALGLARFIPYLIGHYSIGIGFILEMICLSFAISEYVRSMRIQKEKAQEEIINQLQLNEELQREFTDQLEVKVQLRTEEVIQQAQELNEKNILLQQQADDILRLNSLLKIDNEDLKTNIDRVTSDRALAKEINYEEFMKKYGEKEVCFKLLADLKWKHEFSCVKCGYHNYCAGKGLYSRRCTKCSYEESVLNNTLFENLRIPIHKAFYLVYLVNFHKGEISSYKLAEKLDLRQTTCWSYATKVKTRMQLPAAKKELRNKEGWTSLICINP